MELTTGAILRRITETPLSNAAHKLATIILDGIAWKDGYNGLERGTAAFTLARLAEKMGVSRQHLAALLVELAASGLALVRWKPNGKFTPWLFRFGGSSDVDALPDVVSSTGDTSLSRDSKNKTIFAGRSRDLHRSQRLPNTVGGSDPGREGVACLLEYRPSGYLGEVPCLQSGEGKCGSASGVSSGFHAAVAQFFAACCDNACSYTGTPAIR
jgi:hypothetical protein